MSSFQDIRSGRKLIWVGVVLGYLAAILIALINAKGEDGSVLSGLAFLAMLSIPSTMAVFSLDRRPSLLTTAKMAALLAGIFLLTSLVGFVYLVMAIVWYLAEQKRPRPALAPRWASWGRPLLAAAVLVPLLVMFIHLDPRCTTTDGEGNKTTTISDEFPSGWRLSAAGGGSSSSSSSAEGVSVTCSSDTLQPWESAISILASLGVISVASRWPTAKELAESGGGVGVESTV